MSRLSLSDWYRYLESQFVEEERAAQEEQPPAQPMPAAPEPPDSTAKSEPPKLSDQSQPASPVEQESLHPELPLRREYEAYALVSLRIPDFLAFVPLLREELGLSAPKGEASGVESPLVKGGEGEASGGFHQTPRRGCASTAASRPTQSSSSHLKWTKSGQNCRATCATWRNGRMIASQTSIILCGGGRAVRSLSHA
jgi:hypothetical protein